MNFAVRDCLEDTSVAVKWGKKAKKKFGLYSSAERGRQCKRWCRAKPSVNVKLFRWIVKRKFWYLAKLLLAKKPEMAMPRSPGYVNVYRCSLFAVALILTFAFLLHRPQLSFFSLSVFVVGLLLVAPYCTLPLSYGASSREESPMARRRKRNSIPGFLCLNMS